LKWPKRKWSRKTGIQYERLQNLFFMEERETVLEERRRKVQIVRKLFSQKGPFTAFHSGK